MSVSPLASYTLYAASAICGISVLGHTQMGREVVFPALRTRNPGAAKNKEQMSVGAKCARIGWLEGNNFYAVLAILYAKWARTGLVDNYDKSMLAVTLLYQFGMGVEFIKAGVFAPLLPLWLAPGLAVISQVL